MKKALLLFFSIIMVLHSRAELGISWSDNHQTLVLTVREPGDLASGYSWNTAPFNTAKRVAVVTSEGKRLTRADMEKLCGIWNSGNPVIEHLDLSKAMLDNDNDMAPALKVMTKLKSIVFSDNLIQIPGQVLENNLTVERVVIPDQARGKDAGVSIGTGAFHAMKALKEVVIGTGVQTIGQQAFARCPELQQVDFHEGIRVIGNQGFMGNPRLDKIILPEGLEVIESQAFECSGITSIRLPNTLKHIKSLAFAECPNFKTLVIPAGVETVETQTFQKNTALTDVYVLGRNTKCAPNAFNPPLTYAGFVFKDNNDGVVDARDWSNSAGNHPIVLHYNPEAYDDYVNGVLRYLKTGVLGPDVPGYAQYLTENDKVTMNGTVLLKNPQGFFTGNGQADDYAGWKEFMLAVPGKTEETFIDKRLTDGRWYSVCFPFDMTDVQIGNAFGNGTEVCEFSGVEVENRDGKKIITLKFTGHATCIKAHHPYMIHPALHSSTGTFNTIVGITNKKAASVEGRKMQLESEKVEYIVDGVTYKFIGNYEENNYIPRYSYYYYGGDDVYAKGFYKTTADNAVRFTVYSACVVMDKDNGAKDAKDVYSTEPAVTLVETVEGLHGDRTLSGVYDSMGQKVRTGNSGLEGLPKGIYVVDGRKFVK